MAGLLGGGGGGLRGHGELPLNADINVTSLVDVAFVLLIIFMITAPIMQGGVDVRLPRAQARPLEPKSGLVISLDREGKIYLDQAALSYEDFRATFPAFVRTKRPTGVYLRADGRVPYADVVQVLAVIRAAGVAGVALGAAKGGGRLAARGRAAHRAQCRAAAGGDAVHRPRRRHGQHRGRRVSVPGVSAEHRGADPPALAAPARQLAARGGGVVLHSSGRNRERSAVHPALGELRLRPRSTGSGGGGGTLQDVRLAAGRLARQPAVRAVLLHGAAAVKAALVLGAALLLLSASAPIRLSAQDSSLIDRGVRIGIVYRPGVRPGMVLLPGRRTALDSVRAIVARDLDYGDRFEMITLPGGDSLSKRSP